jgi:hypothetical protein
MVLAFLRVKNFKENTHWKENWDIVCETKIEPIYTDKESVEYKRALRM